MLLACVVRSQLLIENNQSVSDTKIDETFCWLIVVDETFRGY